MEKNKILIVDDDKNICKLIKLYLENAGFETVVSNDGSLALDIIQKENIDLVLLDLMLPIINGWEVCKLIRLEYDIPIIMVSARDLVDDKIAGFELGADDYIVKPFDPNELVARVKARLKTNKTFEKAGKTVGLIRLNNLEINISKYEVLLDGIAIDLKPKEIQLLYFLAENKNIVFTREQLLEKIWDYAYSGDTRTVDVHIKCLREKLENTSDKWEIKTIWGVGYKMEVK